MTATCGQTVLIVDIRFVMNSFAVLLTLYREDLLVLRCHPKSPRETRSRYRDALVSAMPSRWITRGLLIAASAL